LALQYSTAPSLSEREKEGEADVVVMKFGLIMQHRLLSLGEITEQSEG